MGHKYTLIFILALIVTFSPFSSARSQEQAFGFRGGLGLNPDQLVLGVQGVAGTIAGPLAIAPSADVGLKDSLVTIAFNLDFRLLVPLPGSGMSVYGSAGPTIAIYKYDNRSSESNIGLSLNGGIMIFPGGVYRYNLEARFGIGDIPDFRLLLGVLF